jgi:hypothetical protein
MHALTDISAREFDRLAGQTAGHFGLIVDRLRNRPGADIESSTVVAYCAVTSASTDWVLTGEGSPPSRRAVRTAVEDARRRLEADQKAAG